MKIRLGVSAALLAALASGSWAETLSLDEAIAIASRNSFSIRIAESNVRKSAAQVDQARAAVLPHATLQGTRTEYDRVQSSFGARNTTVLVGTVGAQIDISGIISRGIKAADLAVRASRAGVDAERNTLRNQVRIAYYSVLRAESNVQVLDEALQNAQRRLDIGQKKLEQGSMSKFDVLRLQTQVSQSEVALVAARNTVRTAKQALNQAMGRAVESDVEVVSIEAHTMDLPPADELVNEAFAKRPELISLQYRTIALEQARKAQELGQAPSLNVSVNVQRNVNPSAFQRKDTALASATITWPIFDAGLTKARVKAAKEDEEQARQQLGQLKLGVSLEVRNALIQLDNARETRRLALQQVAEAKEALRLANVLFENGRGIVLDVTTSEENYTRAQSALNDANYALLAAEASLQKAIGEDRAFPTTPEGK